MNLPTPFLQLQQGASSHEFNIVRMSKEGKNGRHDGKVRMAMRHPSAFERDSS